MEIQYLLYTLLGAGIGILGTLIGAGGGFILVPLLLYIWPKDTPPVIISSVSLAVVCMNAMSGSFAYMRMKRVDFVSGSLFALATLPGAFIGARAANFLPKKSFDIIFGVLLFLIALYLFLRPQKMKSADNAIQKGFHRTLTDADGHTYNYAYNLPAAILLSICVGFLSSILGIGGGIIHVPALVNFFNFPVHVATATSHFTLVFTALAGTIEHIMDGSLQQKYPYVIAIGIGVIIGAQLGARLAKKVKDRWIIRSLSIALCFVGIRIFLTGIEM